MDNKLNEIRRKIGFLRSEMLKAEDAIRKYNDDAAFNGLAFDRHAEGTAAEIFAKSIEIASRTVIDDPLGSPLIPSWNRVTSAVPEFLDMLHDAVEADNK